MEPPRAEARGSSTCFRGGTHRSIEDLRRRAVGQIFILEFATGMDECGQGSEVRRPEVRAERRISISADQRSGLQRNGLGVLTRDN